MIAALCQWLGHGEPEPECPARAAAAPAAGRQPILSLKKRDWPKLERFKSWVLDILNARRVSTELQLESQVVQNLTQYFRQALRTGESRPPGLALGCVATAWNQLVLLIFP
jgi:hypothetical protein